MTLAIGLVVGWGLMTLALYLPFQGRDSEMSLSTALLTLYSVILVALVLYVRA